MNVQSSKEILSALVGFDTVSRNSNLDLIAWIEGYLDKLGVKHQRIYDETGKKSNLWATLGPKDVPGYILSGHTDVVPVDDQNWTDSPVQADRARRQALWPRLDRHEGLCGVLPRGGAGHAESAAEEAAASCLLV